MFVQSAAYQCATFFDAVDAWNGAPAHDGRRTGTVAYREGRIWNQRFDVPWSRRRVGTSGAGESPAVELAVVAAPAVRIRQHVVGLLHLSKGLRAGVA